MEIPKPKAATLRNAQFKCKPDMNPRGGWGNCQKRYGSKGLICYVQDDENSGCKDKVRSSSFKPNYYSWEACK